MDMEWCDPDGYCMVALRFNARQGKTDLRWFTDISNRLCWLHDVEICIYRWYWSELWKQASEMLLFNSHPPRPSHPLPHLKAASGGLIARHDHSESFKLETRSYVEQLQLPCQAPCITLLPSRATMVAKVVNYRKKPLSLSLYIYICTLYAKYSTYFSDMFFLAENPSVLLNTFDILQVTPL